MARGFGWDLGFWVGSDKIGGFWVGNVSGEWVWDGGGAIGVAWEWSCGGSRRGG